MFLKKLIQTVYRF